MSLMRFSPHSRVAVDLDVSFFSDDFLRRRKARLTHISEEGAYFNFSKPLPIALTMALDVPLPGQDRPVHLVAEVLWAKKGVADKKPVYTHGLLFKKMDSDSRARLKAFIDHTMNY